MCRCVVCSHCRCKISLSNCHRDSGFITCRCAVQKVNLVSFTHYGIGEIRTEMKRSNSANFRRMEHHFELLKEIIVLILPLTHIYAILVSFPFLREQSESRWLQHGELSSQRILSDLEKAPLVLLFYPPDDHNHLAEHRPFFHFISTHLHEDHLSHFLLVNMFF